MFHVPFNQIGIGLDLSILGNLNIDFQTLQNHFPNSSIHNNILPSILTLDYNQRHGQKAAKMINLRKRKLLKRLQTIL